MALYIQWCLQQTKKDIRYLVKQPFYWGYIRSSWNNTVHLLSTFRYRRVNMPFPGPPAENEPPPPIIMLSTANGMKSSSCKKGNQAFFFFYNYKGISLETLQESHCKHPPGRSSSPGRSWYGWVLGSGWDQGSHLTCPSPSTRLKVNVTILHSRSKCCLTSEDIPQTGAVSFLSKTKRTFLQKIFFVIT